MEEKKKVKGWSTEEMKNKSWVAREKDTEEMIKWRSMSQEELNECSKRLAGKMEEEVRDKNKVEDSTKRCLQRVRLPFGGVYEKAGNTEHESGEKVVGQECSTCSEKACSVCKACMRIRRKETR